MSEPALPARRSVLVSFPRSGSNFLQTTFNLNGSYRGSSNYAPKLPDTCMQVKSHALCRKDLDRELHAYGRVAFSEFSVLRLIRDPRDVLISLLDYARATVPGFNLGPEEFLNSDYYAIFAPAIGTIRFRDSFVSVLDAARLWIAHWWQPDGPGQTRLLRYEDLLANREGAMAGLFSWLELPVPSRWRFPDHIVAGYGEPDRPRGKVFGWRSATGEYERIAVQADRLLADEIALLGYA